MQHKNRVFGKALPKKSAGNFSFRKIAPSKRAALAHTLLRLSQNNPNLTYYDLPAMLKRHVLTFRHMATSDPNLRVVVENILKSRGRVVSMDVPAKPPKNERSISSTTAAVKKLFQRNIKAKLNGEEKMIEISTVAAYPTRNEVSHRINLLSMVINNTMVLAVENMGQTDKELVEQYFALNKDDRVRHLIELRHQFYKLRY